MQNELQSLEEVAAALVARGKGILAADESDPTIKKRFDTIEVDSTEENRRSYRELLFGTSGLSEYISGVILFDETIRQKAGDGTPFPKFLANQGIIPGIKVDKGAVAMEGSPTEKVTKGLDGLRERLKEYVTLGARFAKWRAVITIGPGIPSPACVEANADSLARYAALCQETGLVPIVEPEVLMDGNHSLERCFEVSELTFSRVFSALAEQGVQLEQMVLKPNMVVSGKDHPQTATVDEVAEATIRCLRSTIPDAVPGIAFLSGGQSEASATAHLNAFNSKFSDAPWSLTFSFGRALQESALKAWKGQSENIEKARAVLLHRARLNGAARQGEYSEGME